MDNPATLHPNATAAASSGAGVAVLIYLLALVGVAVPEPPLAVGIFAGDAVSALVLALGRGGIRGIARTLWRGRS